jgi:hypothetical protein
VTTRVKNRQRVSEDLLTQVLEQDCMHRVHWDHYPLVASNAFVQECPEIQAKIGLAPNTVEAYSRGKTLKTGEKNGTLRVTHPGLRGERHVLEQTREGAWFNGLCCLAEPSERKPPWLSRE